MNLTKLALVCVAFVSTAAWAQPQFTPLGRAGFSNSYATAISADGGVVAGFFDPSEAAFIRTAQGGMTVIDPPMGTSNTVPYAVSSNGVIVGEWRELNAERAFRWTANEPAVDLGRLFPGDSAHAWAMSDDGQVITGSSGSGASSRAFRWTSQSGMIDLNIPESYALAMSANGSVIAGNFNPTIAPGTNLFRWSLSNGLEDLGTLGTKDTYPYFVSPDGAIIIGTAFDTELFSAFRWTGQGGVQLLDLPAPAVSAAAQDASDDGSIIVGYWIDFDYEPRGAIWTNDGAFDLRAYLRSLNTSGLEGWTIRNAVGVSADGSTIIGTGSHDGVDEGFIVTGLPVGTTCPPCAADYNNNGGVDGGDLSAFFSDFEAGEGCSDVDGNGGVDGGDLSMFFTVFEAGGC